MKYFRYMWVGDSLSENRRSIFNKLKKNSLPKDVFVLCLPDEKNRTMDIYPGNVLQQKYFRESEQIVVGLAGSQGEAYEMAGAVLGMIYKNYGTTDISAYVDRVLSVDTET